METEIDNGASKNHKIIREIIGLQRRLYNEKRNVSTSRRRELQTIIERYTTKKGEVSDS